MATGGKMFDARQLVDALHGSGLIGSSHKSQYIKWMLGKVRGDREGDDKTPASGDLYKRPYPRDPQRDPEYAGWSEADWDGKHKPFRPESVSADNRSKFIQALIPTQKKKFKIIQKIIYWK